MNTKLRPAHAEALANRFGELLREMRAIEAEIGCVLMEIASRGVAESDGCRTLARWVELRAGISRQAAGKLIRRAQALNPSPALNGTVGPALAPATGAAARKGEVSTPVIDAIVETLRQVPVSDREWVERQLLDLASRAGPAQVKAAGERLIVRLDREPVLDDVESATPDRESALCRERNGAGIDHLAEHHEADGDLDRSSSDERKGDASAEPATSDLNSPDLDAGSFDDPKTGPSRAAFDDGGESPDSAARHDDRDATTPLAVNGRRNGPTILSRLRSLISAGLRRVLFLKDRSCGYPGCHCPARQCPGHDIEEWADRESGGLVNLFVLSSDSHPLDLAPPEYYEGGRTSKRGRFDPPQPFAA